MGTPSPGRRTPPSQALLAAVEAALRGSGAGLAARTVVTEEPASSSRMFPNVPDVPRDAQIRRTNPPPVVDDTASREHPRGRTAPGGDAAGALSPARNEANVRSEMLTNVP